MNSALRLILVSALLLTGFSLTTTQWRAEQLRLADQSFLQGEIDEVDDNGVWFRVTATGGRVYFAWSQLNQDDANRIRNVSDPDRNIELAVEIDGDRVELVSGVILEGRLGERDGKHILTNKRWPRGRTIEAEDIAEGGIQRGVKIDARVLLEPKEILDAKMEASPPASAEDFYQLARIAEYYSLYSRAHDFLVEASEASPSKRLQSVIEKRLALMKELIKEQALLKTVVEANAMAGQGRFGDAIVLLDAVIREARRDSAIADKLKEERDRVDRDYTDYVIENWYDEIDDQLNIWLSDKENKDAVAQTAVNFARATLDNTIATAIATRANGDSADVRRRFLSRLVAQEGEEKPKVDTIRVKTASFGAGRWYALVGGNIPNGGTKKKAARNNDNDRDRGAGDRDIGRGRGGRDRDGRSDADDIGFQREPKKGKDDGKGVDGETVEDIIRRIAEENERKEREKNDQPDVDTDGASSPPPANIEPLAEWWEKASKQAKRRWLHAAYALNSPNLKLVRQKNDKVWYK